LPELRLDCFGQIVVQLNHDVPIACVAGRRTKSGPEYGAAVSSKYQRSLLLSVPAVASADNWLGHRTWGGLSSRSADQCCLFDDGGASAPSK
jgi:hypothetical protein